MRGRSIELPRLLHLGEGCLGRMGPLLSTDFDVNRVLVGAGAGPTMAFAGKVAAGMGDAGVEVTAHEGLTGSLEQAAALAAMAIEDGVTLMVGVGGGRVIDTVKLAAARTGTDFISVPTTISHDGISSPVASLRGTDRRRRSYAAAMPAGIVVDVEVISSAPEATVRSGAGDLASNLTAVRDWRLADRRGEDRFDAFSAMIAESASKPVLDLTDLASPGAHDALAKGLILSGLAMAAAGTSRPCSGAEHLISHSLDRLLEAPALHGEQVALGTLFSAAAHDDGLHDEVRKFFERVGLPTRPADLGITDEEMIEAVRRAPETRPERFTILNALDDEDISRLYETAFRR
jgi:glycerol-1-phosphate dehydrogenase [NAD(P)+]